MPQAHVQYALVLDRELYEASKVDASLLDLVVRVEGALPGVARPITVLRDYRGPQGIYLERFVLRDGRGRERARSTVRRVELEGEMFRDRFVSTLRDVVIEDPDEHEITFYLNDREAGTIPVFIESGLGGDARLAAEETFTKAVKKGSIVWVVVPQPDGSRHEQPVWYVFSDGKVYVVSGPGEQDVAHLADVARVEITARSKDIRSRVSNVPAAVRVIPPDDPEFDRVAEMALPNRLNLTDPNDAVRRWKDTCVLVELTPRFREEDTSPAPTEVGAGGATPAAQPGAAAPAVAAASKEEDIHVEAEIDTAVFDALIAEGKPERVARAKAKAAYVRKEKQRLRAEREAASA